ncbi:MAG: CheY-like chemotaxis protein [Nitrospinales bacterium]|jgi:CheY-like chemotaxis protein
MTDKNIVLIIEDNEIDREVLRKMLEKIMPSVEIIEVSDSSKGLTEMKNTNFFCILLDYNLPGCDGLQFMQKLILGDYLYPPIIFLTGQDDALLAEQAIKGGASSFIPKNLLTEELLAQTIDKATQLHKSKNS